MEPPWKELRSPSLGATLCGGERAPEAVRLDVVDGRALAVDLHDREQLAVARLELVVAGDVHLAQVEVELLAQLRELRPRAVAEVAPSGVEQHHFGTVG